MPTDLLEQRKIIALAGQILKADTGPKGELTAVINTGFVDRQGDELLSGCWQKCINEQQRPPIFWNHDYHALPLGVVSYLQELRPGDSRIIPPSGGKSNGTAGGLLAKMQFSLGTQAGHDAWVLARDGAIKEFSVSICNEKENEEKTYQGVRRVKLVDELIEVSLVIKGASFNTYSLESKAALARLQSTQAASTNKWFQTAANYAEDYAYKMLLWNEDEEYRNHVVEEGTAVAVDYIGQQMARAKQAAEVERLAGMTGNYFAPKSSLPLTAEELRVKEIRRMAGH